MIRGEIHPLGCPLDEIQLPVCLEQECVLWMYCEVYCSLRKDKIKEQIRQWIKEQEDD